ncbi:hypothetical protein GA0115259_102016 [Streptomyces sp. MnatMP-M17]|nr:hypothetical protein GA0115259_102016 [Streptomyces sp. MnatMP-M17]
MPRGHLPDDVCGYFEVPSHVLCANVNSVRKHDQRLDLVEGVYAPHVLDAQSTRLKQGTFWWHVHAFHL